MVNLRLREVKQLAQGWVKKSWIPDSIADCSYSRIHDFYRSVITVNLHSSKCLVGASLVPRAPGALGLDEQQRISLSHQHREVVTFIVPVLSTDEGWRLLGLCRRPSPWHLRRGAGLGSAVWF